LEIIQAVSLLIQRGYPVHLSVFGSGAGDPEYAQRCEALVRNSRIAEHVRFEGHVTDITQIYSGLEIVLSTSTFESFPNSIKEGVASGVLVVASQVGGIGELMKDGTNGILTEGCHPEEIAQAIMRAISLSPEESLRIRRNAYRMAREEFHPRRGLLDLLSMYNLALQAHSVSPVDHSASMTSQPAIEASGVKPHPGEKGVDGVGIVNTPSLPPISHLHVGQGITYPLTPKRPNWTGLDVLLGTHQRQASGILNLRILSDTGAVVRETSIDLERARDNEWFQIRFPPIVNSGSIPFFLEFKVRNAGPGTLISLYGASPSEGMIYRLIQRVGIPVSGKNLYCRVWYAT
jgi:hypothetical protein